MLMDPASRAEAGVKEEIEKGGTKSMLSSPLARVRQAIMLLPRSLSFFLLLEPFSFKNWKLQSKEKTTEHIKGPEPPFFPYCTAEIRLKRTNTMYIYAYTYVHVYIQLNMLTLVLK